MYEALKGLRTDGAAAEGPPRDVIQSLPHAHVAKVMWGMAGGY